MKELIELVFDTAEKNNIQLETEVDLITDLGYNSISLIQLLALVEENFAIEFDVEDIDIDVIRKLSTFINLVENKIADVKE